MSLKPIKLFSHASGPNPWKVAIILEELSIPYESEFMDMAVLHTPVFEQHNPNGRVPTIIDPNTGLTLWESGAIIQYLIETYDKSNKLSSSTSPAKYQESQFLHFQTSGQGPYFGQAAWFTNFHAEQIPSAQDRYLNEIKRVTKVLNSALEKNGGKSLVGDKVTYADLSFVPWYWLVDFIDKKGGIRAELEKENPAWAKWNQALNERPAVKKMFEERNKKMSEGH